MITPILEQLISNGIASYRTFNTMSESSVIEVGDNQTIIITDITYHSYIDASTEPLTELNLKDAIALMNTCVHGITIYSSKSRNQYIVRDQFFITYLGLGLDQYQIDVKGNVHYNTYLTHNDNIYIDVVKYPDITGMTNTFGKWEDQSQAVRPPLGFKGQSVTVRRTLGDVDNSGFVPVGRQNKVTNAESYEATIPSNTDTLPLPPDPTNELAMKTFPIINIGYVTINKEANSKLQGTF